MARPKTKIKEVNYYRASLTAADAYLLYLDNLKTSTRIPENQKDKYRISHKLFISILDRFMELQVERILDGYPFFMPYRLGSIRIDKRPMQYDPSKMRVDWKRTKESGCLMYHMNEHSGGFYMRYHWNKVKAIVKNKGKYSFAATRGKKGIKKKLTNAVRSGKTYITFVNEWNGNT
jgi:hypothetical protein